jgi:asparagine synthase (glutamine-hydrolysing)
MTMAHSLEARVPLLDHLVVESAYRLPSRLKLGQAGEGGTESKYALKKVMEAYLPREVIYRRKQGFDVPVRRWIEGPFLAAVGERLLGGRLHAAGLIREAGVRKLLARAGDASHNYSSMLMVLLALEAWADACERRVGALDWS